MSETFNLSKEALSDQAKHKMQSQFVIPERTKRQKLAALSRILFDHGHDAGLPGQITTRGDESGTYYTQQLGLGFDEITATNLLLVNEDLEVLEGTGMPNPANRFHSWLYRTRSDIQCIVHTHPKHTVALSMIGQPLTISHMDHCVLYDDCAFLEKWPGVPVGNEEGEIIAEAIGDKRAILLAHHGMLIAAQSIEEASTLAIQFERAAEIQLMAMAAGEIKAIDPVLGKEAHDWILTPRRSQIGFEYYIRRALKNHPDMFR